MPLLQCDVLDGPRQGFKAIGIASIEGFTEYLTIEDRFLVDQDGEFFLPVRLVGKDNQHKTALIQLPVEADSGANRVWVWEQNLKTVNREVSA
mgnify:CR=1 FL=1